MELRYEWNAELRVSQMFRSWEALEASAEEKRQELQVRRLALSAIRRPTRKRPEAPVAFTTGCYATRRRIA